MREPPEGDGAVRAGADQGAAVGAQLDPGDGAAVSHSDVSHGALHVVPHLHQLVISSCGGKRNTYTRRLKVNQST